MGPSIASRGDLISTNIAEFLKDASQTFTNTFLTDSLSNMIGKPFTFGYVCIYSTAPPPQERKLATLHLHQICMASYRGMIIIGENI
jgi:hypothetical protein